MIKIATNSMLGQENVHILLQIHLVSKQVKVKLAVKVSPSTLVHTKRL